MPVELNHTIVHARNQREAATFVAEILGLPEPQPFGHFLVVKTSNRVSLDFAETDEEFESQHYAFHVSEKEFDEIFARIKGRGVEYWADPLQEKPGESYTYGGGRGVYFEDPGGNMLEILTWR
jgi:catechol 2,3-dioxygenase-like lactoylglutathione lyase family enzyme